MNRLSIEEVEELSRLRAAACGKNLLDAEAVDFAHRVHQQWGRIEAELRTARVDGGGPSGSTMRTPNRVTNGAEIISDAAGTPRATPSPTDRGEA